ncbi:MAG: ShlB/FhaC/HecB family hemolysin secretion/activation protein [Rubrivivax sp.]
MLCAALAIPPAQAADPPLPPVPAAAPLQAQRVRFEGLSALPAAELEALAAPFLGRPLRALELEELRQRVTRALIERGFVNSGALLADPAVDAEGTLTLRIVEGRVTRLRAQGLERLDEAYLSSRLLRVGEPFNLNALQERFQLLLADPLFERLNARLLPDEGLGRAVLDVDVTRARPWSFSLFANNQLAPAIGSAAAGVDGSIRNITGWGDALAATAYAGRGGNLSHDASWALPLFARSTVATLRLARLHASVVEEPVKVLDVDSLVGVREFGISQPLIDDARRRLTIALTHSLRHNATTILGGLPYSAVAEEPTGTTRTESWRLQPELTLRLDRHVLALRATLLKGRNNLPADPVLPDTPPRRYTLWQLQGQAALAMGDDGSQWLLRAQAQHSPDRLVPLEQMAIGGRQTVRGYRENTLVRDNAWSASVEYHRPVWRSDEHRAALKLVPFVDAGQVLEPGRGAPQAGLGRPRPGAELGRRRGRDLLRAPPGAPPRRHPRRPAGPWHPPRAARPSVLGWRRASAWRCCWPPPTPMRPTPPALRRRARCTSR